mmetsp:Transcript_92722/g.144617  ORF Transcript_92722/g.144617 Transcript_92722/m.144617 type:complete len:169 (+) Transcript_92722:54-560(+)
MLATCVAVCFQMSLASDMLSQSDGPFSNGTLRDDADKLKDYGNKFQKAVEGMADIENVLELQIQKFRTEMISSVENAKRFLTNMKTLLTEEAYGLEVSHDRSVARVDEADKLIRSYIQRGDRDDDPAEYFLEDLDDVNGVGSPDLAWSDEDRERHTAWKKQYFDGDED